MAYDEADGPPHFDATHAWAPFTGAAPPVINDPGGYPPALPWVKLKRTPTNWFASPELDDNRSPRTYGNGEVPYESKTLGITRVYEIEVRADSREDMNALMWALRMGYSHMDHEGTMTVSPYDDPGGIDWTFGGRVLAFTPDDSFVYDDNSEIGRFLWGAQLTLRSSDPTFYPEEGS